MILRRIFFWFLLLCSLVVLFWWVAYVPKNRERLERAVPQGVDVLSRHYNVAGRWSQFTANPVIKIFLSKTGLNLEQVNTATSEKKIRLWLERIFSDETLVARLPSLGFETNETWVFTSWVGGYSQVLRWVLHWEELHPFTKVGVYGGRVLWTFYVQDEASVTQVFFTLVEGGLIGCVAEHPETLQLILDSYDGRYPSEELAFASLADHAESNKEEFLDQGYVKPKENDLSACYNYALTEMNQNGLSGTINLNSILSCSTSNSVIKADTTGLDQFFGDIPIGALTCSAKFLHEIPQEKITNGWGKDVFEALTQINAQALGLFLLNDEYKAKIRGFKIPGLILTIRISEPETTIKQVNKIIDQLNARYQWGLVAHPEPAGDKKVYQLESTGKVPYPGFGRSEKFGYALCGEWLFISPDSENLIKLVARYQRTEALDEIKSARWLKDVEKNIPAYFWFDMQKGGKAIRLALAGYTLRMLFQPGEKDTQQLHQRITELNNWSKTLESLEVCQVWVKTFGEKTTIDFSMGAK